MTGPLADAKRRPMSARSEVDWGAWSREAVTLMRTRNEAWMARFGAGSKYNWDVNSATITFDRGADVVLATIAVVGTVSRTAGTFLWSWANESMPANVSEPMRAVRAFGERHDLRLLIVPEFHGGHAEALEMLSIAGRVLDAAGVFIAPAGDVTLYFTLSDFRVAPRK